MRLPHHAAAARCAQSLRIRPFEEATAAHRAPSRATGIAGPVALPSPLPVSGTGEPGARGVLEMPAPGSISAAMQDRTAKFRIGQVVRHRVHPFRGVIFDVDPVFSSTEEWWESIPEHLRPSKDQPFYHLLAENETTAYVAYVSEQNLLTDDSGEPVQHPHVGDLFGELHGGQYVVLEQLMH